MACIQHKIEQCVGGIERSPTVATINEINGKTRAEHSIFEVKSDINCHSNPEVKCVRTPAECVLGLMWL